MQIFSAMLVCVSGKFRLSVNTDISTGWTQDLSGSVCDRALSHVDGCYNIPNVHVRGRLAKTNTMSNTAFRGFGGPQGIFISECYMEEIADRLDIPVERLREINFYQPDEETHFNQKLKDWHVPLMYKQVLEESNYEERRVAVTKFNAEHKWKKRGLSIVPTKFGISFTALVSSSLSHFNKIIANTVSVPQPSECFSAHLRA